MKNGFAVATAHQFLFTSNKWKLGRKTSNLYLTRYQTRGKRGKIQYWPESQEMVDFSFKVLKKWDKKGSNIILYKQHKVRQFYVANEPINPPKSSQISYMFKSKWLWLWEEGNCNHKRFHYQIRTSISWIWTSSTNPEKYKSCPWGSSIAGNSLLKGFRQGAG